MDSIRGYARDNCLHLFRVREHVQRLHDSAKLYHLTVPFDVSTLEKAVVDLVRVNKINSDCYVQLQANPGNLPRIGSAYALEAKMDVTMLAALNPTILGVTRFQEERRAVVSSWKAIPQDVLPLAAKANGHFANYFLAGVEAKKQGAGAAILLDHNGLVCEFTSANIFLVRKDGTLVTPPSSTSILAGITRNTLIHLITDLDLDLAETSFPRSELYKAAEIFMCGTGAEITPITQVDDAKLTQGPGPITKRITEYFLEVVTGQVLKYRHWTTTVQW